MEEEQQTKSFWNSFGLVGYRDYETMTQKINQLEEMIGELHQISLQNLNTQKEFLEELKSIHAQMEVQKNIEETLSKQIEMVQTDIEGSKSFDLKMEEQMENIFSTIKSDNTALMKQLKSKLKELNLKIESFDDKKDLQTINELLRILIVNNLLDETEKLGK